jgi:hypothetical protein
MRAKQLEDDAERQEAADVTNRQEPIEVTEKSTAGI